MSGETTDLVWLALFALAVAVFIGGVIFFSARHVRRRNEEAYRVWKIFAREQGLRWTEVAKSWFSRGVEVHGEASGVPVRLDKFVVNSGKHSVTFTRFASELPRRVESPIRIDRRSFLTTIGEWLGLRTIATDDSAFDARMAVRSKDKSAALEIVSPEVRARLLEFPRSAQVKCKANEAKLWWRGMESDPSVLQAALGIVVALSR